jgi:hypothetical protein
MDLIAATFIVGVLGGVGFGVSLSFFLPWLNPRRGQ